MISIIVPVYDGYEQTVKCITSLQSTINKSTYNIILINDNSPNPKIVNYLNAINKKNISIITNKENLGFVKSVNLGMKHALGDVILLNSDTIVTNHWIDKLYAAAYSSKKVGTVTTLTNNGTIASVPNFNKDNQLPDGYSIDKFSKLVEKVSKKNYPVIPTAVGHAMYIKRELIDKIGYFDSETFGMGYGEEMDYSFRAIKKGYKNILADDTFIFHFGSASFKENKKKQIIENKKKLLKKHIWYPVYIKFFIIFNKEVKDICREIQKRLN